MLRMLLSRGRSRQTLTSLAGIAGDPGWRGHVGDLSWERLEPWREHVASLFDASLKLLFSYSDERLICRCRQTVFLPSLIRVKCRYSH